MHQHAVTLSMLQLLLDSRADVNALDVSLRSPIFYITPPCSPDHGGWEEVELFRKRVLRTLLTSRANPNFADAAGLTCFEFQESTQRERASMLTGSLGVVVEHGVDGQTDPREAQSPYPISLGLKGAGSDLSAPGGPEFQVKGRFNLVVGIKPPVSKKTGDKKNQCFRCLEFGHSYKACCNPPRCRICGCAHETNGHVFLADGS